MMRILACLLMFAVPLACMGQDTASSDRLGKIDEGDVPKVIETYLRLMQRHVGYVEPQRAMRDDLERVLRMFPNAGPQSRRILEELSEQSYLIEKAALLDRRNRINRANTDERPKIEEGFVKEEERSMAEFSKAVAACRKDGWKAPPRVPLKNP